MGVQDRLDLLYWQAANAKLDVALVDVSALKSLGHVGLDAGAFHVKTYLQTWPS